MFQADHTAAPATSMRAPYLATTAASCCGEWCSTHASAPAAASRSASLLHPKLL
jgi:hypothetical protein